MMREILETVRWLKEEMVEIKKKEQEEQDRKTKLDEALVTSLRNIEDNWNQLKSARAIAGTSRSIEPTPENLGKPPEVGFSRYEGDVEKIHCGQGIWIPKIIYTNAVANARSHGMFVKNISVGIFGHEDLKNSSVTGGVCNRTKSEKKPPLDPTKILAVRDIFRYYLKFEKRCTEDAIATEENMYIGYIRGKISDMNRLSKPKSSTSSKTAVPKKVGKSGKDVGKVAKDVETSDDTDSTESESFSDSGNTGDSESD